MGDKMCLDKCPLCPLCSGTFNTPKVLPCFHTVCQNCLVIWLDNNDLWVCPVCKTPIFLNASHQPFSGEKVNVDFLPTNLLLESVTRGWKTLSGPSICDLCPHNAASVYCFDCEQKLCDTCSRYSCEQKLFDLRSQYHMTIMSGKRGHTLKSLDSLTVQDLSDSFRFSCKKHEKRKAEVYCASHREFMCAHCTVQHLACTEGVVVIACAAQRYRREVVHSCRAHEQLLISRAQAQSKSCNKQQHDVNKAFKELAHHLENQRQELLKVIQSEEKDLEEMMNNIKSGFTFVEDVLKSKSDAVVVQMMKDIKPWLRTVKRCCKYYSNTSLEPPKVVEIDDEILGAVKLGMGLLGKGRVKSPTSNNTALQDPTNPSPHHLTTCSHPVKPVATHLTPRSTTSACSHPIKPKPVHLTPRSTSSAADFPPAAATPHPVPWSNPLSTQPLATPPELMRHWPSCPSTFNTTPPTVVNNTQVVWSVSTLRPRSSPHLHTSVCAAPDLTTGIKTASLSSPSLSLHH